MRAMLRADPSITTGERARILVALRDPEAPAPAATAAAPGPCLLRAKEVAARLACSTRTIARLAAEGHLPRRRLPGRKRAVGFLAADVDALLLGKGAV
jgi:excisionase family DNA binding protein